MISLDNLDVFGGNGNVCNNKRKNGKIEGSFSCRNSPVFLSRELAETKNALNGSADSFLSQFAVSIENMQRSSEFLERIIQVKEFKSNPSVVSLDANSKLQRNRKDGLSESLNNGESIPPEPLKSTSVEESKMEYNSETANLWLELTNIDVSPVLPKRKSRTFCESARHVLNKIDPTSLQRYPISSEPQRPINLNLGSQSPEEVKEPKYPNEGSVHFKFQYLIITERLKVTVINASNIFKGEKPDSDVNVVAEICLMPGKLQRQVSKPAKAWPNPTFDHVVYFHGISLFETHQMCLRIKIMAKERVLKKSRIIGEVTVSLDDFDLVSETVLEENFNTRIGTRSGSMYGIRHVIVQ